LIKETLKLQSAVFSSLSPSLFRLQLFD